MVATSYLLGVSTRRVEKLAASLGVVGLPKSQVSAMAAELDELVEGFRESEVVRGDPRRAQVAEYAEPVVDRDDDHVAFPGEPVAAVPPPHTEIAGAAAA